MAMKADWENKDQVKHLNMEGTSRDGSPVEKLENAVPGYGMERRETAQQDILDAENPNVFHHVSLLAECEAREALTAIAR